MKFDTDGWYLTRGCWGSLQGILIAPRKNPPTAVVTLCHGFGAPGTDLVPLAEEIVPYLSDGTPAPAFLFPEGPIDLGEIYGMDGANAWWELNMARLAQLAATNDFNALRNEVPPGIDEAREALENCIAECVESQRWESPKMIFGGFSQGSMLAVDLALRSQKHQCEGLILWSGALICESLWQQAFTERSDEASPRSIPCFQTHGREDTILPIGTGRALNEFLQSLGIENDYHEFQGPHTIPAIGISGAAKLIDTAAR
jgi:phospholipase/carboxylesterase